MRPSLPWPSCAHPQSCGRRSCQDATARIAALQSSRVIQPGYSNWLLFSAMVEAALSFMGVWWDPMRVDYAIRTVDTMRLQTIPATRHKKLDEGQRLRLRSCRRLPPAALTPHT